MPRPYVLSFGSWMPDGADIAFGVPYQYSATPVPLADCLNVYFAQGAYRSLPGFSGLSGALAAQCLGAFTAINSAGSPVIYAAAGADLYQRSGSAWNAVSKSAGAYSGAAHWSFVEFAGCVLATDGIRPLQDAAIGSNFADVTDAPIGNVLGVIGQFVMVGDIQGSPAYPYRVQWCAIGDPTTWPTPLTDAAVADQSSSEDLDQTFGQVLFIGGGPQFGIVMQKNGITRMAYQGGDVVFADAPYERKRGLIARGAAVQNGALTHFIADDGFQVTDGSSVTPTGTTNQAALDKWFWNNVNQNALAAIRAGWDADKQCVAYAIPTGSNTLPDTLLMLNPSSGYWTKSALATEMLFSDNDGTRHRLGVFDQSHTLGYLSGAPASGYCETYDLSFVDGALRSIIEAQPNVVCTDTPTMRIGTRQTLKGALSYTADAAPDGFSGRCTWDPPPEALMVRARLTSAAASALYGATIYSESTSPV